MASAAAVAQQQPRIVDNDFLEMRRMNLSAHADGPAEERFTGARDSSIKKCTGMVKKLRSVTIDNKDQLVKELAKVNLSKFLSEGVQSILDNKMKASDVDPLVEVCSSMHSTYSEFSKQLRTALLKPLHKSCIESISERKDRLTKRKNCLRLLFEATLAGIIKEPLYFVSGMKEVLSQEAALEIKDESNVSYPLVSMVTLILKVAGVHIWGMSAPPGVDDNGGETESEKAIPLPLLDEGLLNKDKVSALRSILGQFYDGLLQHLKGCHADLMDLEKRNHVILMTRGELSEETKTKYENAKKGVDKLKGTLEQLAQQLGKEVPELQDSDTTSRMQDLPPALQPEADVAAENESPFDDTDTQAFYEDICDLRTRVPSVLLDGKPSNDQGLEEEELQPQNALAVDDLLGKLPKCVSRDLDDDWCIEFCSFNSKAARKKVVRALFNVPKSRQELLSHYARIAATLGKELPDISASLVTQLEDEFTGHVAKKDQNNLDAKIRNIRFIGELTKFMVVKAPHAFHCFQTCLDDFSHHNVEVVCHLLETCGRYLYRRPDTHIRCRNLLEVMMRLRQAKHLDARVDAMVENAYFMCRPPEKSAIAKTDKRDPMHEYIRKLILEDLSAATVDNVLVQLRKLHWPECRTWVVDTLLEASKGRFQSLPQVASVVTGLNKYYDYVAISVIDSLVEEILSGLEKPDFRTHQRMIANLKLVGELYNYSLLDSRIIFDIVWTLLWPGPEHDLLPDPPEDTFRIRMVCSLLEACGHYFTHGHDGKKLEYALIGLFRYSLSKVITMDVEFVLSDILQQLRPNMQRPTTHEECEKMMASLRRRSKGTRRLEYGPEVHIFSNREGEGDESESDEDGDEDDEEDEQAVDDSSTRVKDNGGGSVESDSEDDEFDAEFNSMMQSSIESRKFEKPKSMNLEAVLSSKVVTGATEGSEAPKIAADESRGHHQSTVNFQMLVRKGQKTTTKTLAVPAAAGLASVSMDRSQAEKEEAEQLKKRVLQLQQSQHEEEVAQDQPSEGGGGVPKTSRQRPVMQFGGARRGGRK